MKTSRRTFLKGALGAAAGVALGAPLAEQLVHAASADKSTVVVVASERVFARGDELGRKVTADMVRAAVESVTGEQGAAAWKSMFRPTDVVGLKVNALGKRLFSPHVALVEAIIDGVASAGVPRRNIIVWDRMSKELEEAGFTVRTTGEDYRCFGTDQPGVGFDERLILQGEIGSLFSSIVTRHCTALINVPVLKDHDLAGVSVSMKNYFGAIHNPNKYHKDNLHRALADLNSVPALRSKTRLIICDATRCVYDGGPAFKAKSVERLNAILVSRDPVALDRVAWDEIEKLRAAHDLPPLTLARREPKYIALAGSAAYGLGEADLDAIDVARLTV